MLAVLQTSNYTEAKASHAPGLGLGALIQKCPIHAHIYNGSALCKKKKNGLALPKMKFHGRYFLPCFCFLQLLRLFQNGGRSDLHYDYQLTEEYCQNHFLTGLLLREVGTALQDVTEVRQNGIRVLRNLLAKHSFDDRYLSKVKICFNLLSSFSLCVYTSTFL